MSLRIDLEDAIRNLRLTLENLGSDLQRLEGLVENHFTLKAEPTPMPRLGKQTTDTIMHGLEKDIKALNSK